MNTSKSGQRVTYARLYDQIRATLEALAVLSGDVVGTSGSDGWQSAARESSARLKALAEMLDCAVNGKSEPFLSFPSIADIVDDIY